MQFSITDSESAVKRGQAGRFRISSLGTARVHVVANRNEALSDYIRTRIREWQSSGREMQELARIVGVAKSGPSGVVRSGVGIGKKSAIGYAVAFGFGTRNDPESAYAAIQAAAYQWWMAKGQHAAEVVSETEDPSMLQAIEVLKDHMQATEAQIRAIMADYIAPRFVGRDSMFWIETIGAELKRDRAIAELERAHVEDDRKTQAAVRVAHRERAKAERATAAVPAPKSSIPPPHKRRQA